MINSKTVGAIFVLGVVAGTGVTVGQLAVYYLSHKFVPATRPKEKK